MKKLINILLFLAVSGGLLFFAQQQITRIMAASSAVCSGVTAFPTAVYSWVSVTVTANGCSGVASYSWSADGGITQSSSTNTTTWTAPIVDTITTFHPKVTVCDASSACNSYTTSVSVHPPIEVSGIVLNDAGSNLCTSGTGSFSSPIVLSLANTGSALAPISTSTDAATGRYAFCGGCQTWDSTTLTCKDNNASCPAGDVCSGGVCQAAVSSTAPGAPTGATAVAGNTQATVNWSAPASDGGSPITGYTVTSSPGGKTCTTTGALTCTVSGLTNGTSYTFTVVATNAIGNSTPSAASNSVTPINSTVMTVSGTYSGVFTPFPIEVTVGGTPCTGANSIGGGLYSVNIPSACAQPGEVMLFSIGGQNVGLLTSLGATCLAYTPGAVVNNVSLSGGLAQNSSCGTSIPGVPTGVTATSGDAQATVNWNAPASNGGSAITGYTVTSSPGAKTCTTSGALSCTVTGLTNGTSYTFTVHATNAIGNSAESSPTTPVTPTKTLTVVTFTLPGSTPWVAPAGVTSVMVECWGAGGGGGGASKTLYGGAGGGGGSYAKKTSATVTPGNTYNVTVGLGGTGGTGGAVSTAGGLGFNSSFPADSGMINCGGGSGGAAGANFANTGGVRGTSFGGDVNFVGGTGAPGIPGGFGTGGGGGGGAGSSGNGGTSLSNTGGTGTATGGGNGGNGGITFLPAQAGSASGGGGGGADANVNFNGQKGANGKVILTY